MRKSCICICLCLLLFSVLGASAQTEEQSGLIKSADGFLVVSNESGNYFTIEIKGKSIKPIPDRPFWFQVDGKFFQIVNAEKKQFLKDPRDKSLDDKAILSAHRGWESDYISETLGAKLKVNSAWIKLQNGMTALAWDYDMPQVADKQTAKRQLYLIVVKGDHVLGLNTVVEKDGEEKALQQLLIDTLETLKPRDKPLSLEKAREQVLKGSTQTSFEYLAEGSKHYAAGDYKRAIPPYQKALDLEKDDRKLEKKFWILLVDNLGMSYGITGDIKGSQAVFEYGISKEPTYPLFYYNMACGYGELGDEDNAIKWLRLAFKYKANMLVGERFPNPETDSSFEKFRNSEKFKKAIRDMQNGA